MTFLYFWGDFTFMESFEIEQHVLFSVAICSFTLYQCFQCPRMGLDVNIKGEFQICPRMDFHNILYAEYLRYNNYKNEIISFLEGC